MNRDTHSHSRLVDRLFGMLSWRRTNDEQQEHRRAAVMLRRREENRARFNAAIDEAEALLPPDLRIRGSRR